MKKIATLVIALFAIGVVFGQNLSLTQYSYTVNGPSGTAFHLEDTVYVRNNSNNDLTVRVRRYVTTVLAGTENYFCWGATCYPPNTSVSNSPLDSVVIPAQGVNKTFKGYIDPQFMVGTEVIKYCFFNKNQDTDSTCFTVTYNTGVNSIDEETAVKVSNPFPNPSSEFVNFTYSINNLNKASLKVYNMLGALVKTVNITDNTGKLAVNTSDLRAGLYLYDLQVNGKSFKTGKFTVIQ